MIDIKCDICGKPVKADTVLARFKFEPNLPQNMRCKTEFEFCAVCATRLSNDIENKILFPEQCQGTGEVGIYEN